MTFEQSIKNSTPDILATLLVRIQSDPDISERACELCSNHGPCREQGEYDECFCIIAMKNLLAAPLPEERPRSEEPAHPDAYDAYSFEEAD